MIRALAALRRARSAAVDAVVIVTTAGHPPQGSISTPKPAPAASKGGQR